MCVIRYHWGDKPGIGINIVNQEGKSYDSLEVRLYFRAQEGFEKNLGARLDICVLYREDGYQETIEGELRQRVWDNLVKQKPKKMEDTYDPTDQTYLLSYLPCGYRDAFSIKDPSGLSLSDGNRRGE
jgi:hypothetical protein